MKTIKVHTPAPWEFRYYHTSRCSILVSKHPRAGSASVRDALKGVRVTTDLMVYDDQSNVDQLSPDARLLLAAPELFKALRQMVGAVTRPRARSARVTVSTAPEPAEFAVALAAAQAALAKAGAIKRSRRPSPGQSTTMARAKPSPSG